MRHRADCQSPMKYRGREELQSGEKKRKKGEKMTCWGGSTMRKDTVNIKGERGTGGGSREISYFYLIGQANFKQFSGTICAEEHPTLGKHSFDITPLL